MDDTQSNSSASSFRSLFLELVPKISLSFVTLSYVFGFIIVNTHLGNFGIVSIVIIKAKYIAAGAVFLVIVLLVGITIYPLLLFITRQQESLNWEEILYSAGSLGFMMFLLMIIAPETVFHNDHSSIYSKILICLWIICWIQWLISLSRLSSKLSKLRAPLFFLSMGGIAYLSIEPHIFWIFLDIAALGYWVCLITAGILKVRKKEKKVSDLTLSTMWVVFFLLSLCNSYSDNLYPKIASKYGGGKPISVTLLLTRDKNLGLESLFYDNQKLLEGMEDVTLLDEDADYFFIQKQTGQEIKIIRIRKPLVNAVISLKK